MRKLERGDFRASMSESLTEEYTQMSYGFNHMVNRLQEPGAERAEASAAKREAQAGLLEAQIKPHFLYNTLDMIHWKAMDYDAQDISYMITQLGKMLRIGLSGGRMLIRLRDELEHARCYVSIQQERLPIAIEYTESISTRQSGVISFRRLFSSRWLRIQLFMAAGSQVPALCRFIWRSGRSRCRAASLTCKSLFWITAGAWRKAGRWSR